MSSINIPIFFFSTGFLLALSCNMNDQIASSTIAWIAVGIAKFCCWIPILVSIGVLLWDTRRKRDLEKFPLYDSNGTKLTPSSKNHLPFLPDKHYCSEDEYLSKQVEIKTQIWSLPPGVSVVAGSEDRPHANTSWALVTGASQGIGRAICVSLARRNVSIVLVARNQTKLKALAEELMVNYSITAIPMDCDLSEHKSIDGLIQKLRKTYVDNSTNGETILDNIDILINNAGLGNSCDFFDTNETEHQHNTQNMASLNIVGVTKLTQIIGKHMKDNTRRPTGARIVFVSSIMGFMPGVPGSAVYAATKAYQRSLCASLGDELEGQTRRVAVVCMLPGAVTQTNFARASHMTESAVFHLLPGWGLALTPYQVAEATVQATIRGTSREIHVGWFYILVSRISTMFPDCFIVTMAGLTCGHKKAFQFQSKLGRILSNILLSNADSNAKNRDGDEKHKNN